MTDDQASDRGITPSRSRTRKGKLERGWRKNALIRQLAEGELSQIQLASEHGVAQSSISEFNSRHSERIALVRANIEDEFVGLWVAKKSNRLAEYEADIEAINEALSAGLDEEADVVDPDKLRTAKHRALRAVAEELGQLPNRLSVQADQRVTVEHRVTGLNVEDLK